MTKSTVCHLLFELDIVKFQVIRSKGFDSDIVVPIS